MSMGSKSLGKHEIIFFMHGPLFVGYPVAKQNPKVFAQIATISETPEKDAGKIKERINQQNQPTLNISNVSDDKLVNGSLSSGKGGKGLEKSPGSMNGFARSQTTYDPVRSSSSYSSSQNLHVQHDRRLLHWREAGEVFEKSSGLVGYTELEKPLNHQLQSPSDRYQNAQAAEEVFRDSSPGFDVLVHHVVWDVDYFHEKDGYSEPYSKHDKNMKDGYHAHNSYKDQHLHGSTIGSRLGGRITLPKPHSPEYPSIGFC